MPDEVNDGPSPSTESEGSEPHTPESDYATRLQDDLEKPAWEGFCFEDYLNCEMLYADPGADPDTC